MGKHRIFTILLLAILGILLAALLMTPKISQADEHGAQAVALDKVHVVGSRRPVRTTADARLPSTSSMPRISATRGRPRYLS